MIELYRCVIPASKVINDNAGQHYRTHMGKLEWLTNQFNLFFKGGHVGPGNFRMPNIDDVIKYLNKKEFISIRCEVWRCRNIRFDPQNYAKTFKAPIDLLVSNGYIQDDNWKFVDGITYCGGGPDVWPKRHFKYNDDGLPDNLTPDWWLENCSGDYNDILIRIIVS